MADRAGANALLPVRRVRRDGATTTLRYLRGTDAVYADVASGRILTDARTAGQCLKAYDAQMRRAGETSGQRRGRMAGESQAVRNARLFLTHLEASRPRRDLRGRFAGHSCEPAGRR